MLDKDIREKRLENYKKRIDLIWTGLLISSAFSSINQKQLDFLNISNQYGYELHKITCLILEDFGAVNSTEKIWEGPKIQY